MDCELGFRIAGPHRIEIGCFEWNEGAGRLYERLGFRLEGRKRDFIWFDGRFYDTVEVLMLEHGWRAKYLGRTGVEGSS